MAEIKSTLDIVMEKTKNLTMTEEERQELLLKKGSEKVKVWVQKFLDDKMALDQLKAVFQQESKKSPELKSLIKVELRERLSVERHEDNAKIFQLLSELLDIEIAPFAQAIGDFKNKITAEREKRISSLKYEFQKMGIHGSSVLPNLFQDEQWFATEKALNNDFKQQLRKL